MPLLLQQYYCSNEEPYKLLTHDVNGDKGILVPARDILVDRLMIEFLIDEALKIEQSTYGFDVTYKHGSYVLNTFIRIKNCKTKSGDTIETYLDRYYTRDNIATWKDVDDSNKILRKVYIDKRGNYNG